jgi:hypothetical protein
VTTLSALKRQTAGWHRQMMVFAGLMAVAAVLTLVGVFVDDRTLLGAPIWLKPFKFAIAGLAYCVTWAWMVSLLRQEHRRLADRTSTVLVWMLGFEYVLIVAQVLRGKSSHFNVSTTAEAVIYSTMGVTIAALWTGTLILTILVMRLRIADAASRWAVQLGAAISLIGLALGGLMLGPTSGQLDSMKNGTYAGVVGAHSVGVEDGGPTMALTGWSTVGGDLRIPHFVGMHALQVLPILLLVLGVVAARVPVLRDPDVRGRLVLVAGSGYTGLLALVTWQALRGQSLIHPDVLTLTGLAVVVVGTVVGAVVAMSVPTSTKATVG